MKTNTNTNTIAVVLMMLIVSVAAFANERQRVCHAAAEFEDDRASLDRVQIIVKEVDVTN